MHPIIKIIASTPAAILCTIGALGLVLSWPNAGWILSFGIILQGGWLAPKIIRAIA